ncbi:MAG: hypothetical protein LBU65_16900 [Planctomycetaceae bacterium]|jgi:hypothetical protein|nr:hypothetical protein [Planctomycetaceae bacterium]
MFRRLKTFIESYWDNANPIMVRDLRRWNRRLPFYVIFIIGLLSAIVSIIISLVVDPNEYEMDGKIWGGTDFLCFLWFFCGTIMSVLAPTINFTDANDELFSAVPLSPRTQVHGYLATGIVINLCVLLSSFPILLFVILDSTILQLHSYTLSDFGWMLFVICLILLVGLSGGVYFFSFITRASFKVEVGIAVLLAFSGLLTHLTPIYLFLFNVFAVEWLPCSTLVPLILIGLTGYRLSLYHFSCRNESFIMSLVANFVVYSLLIMALLFVFFDIAIFV